MVENQWRVFCGGLLCADELKSMECIVTAGGIDVWCGTMTSVIEVWTINFDPSATWGTGIVEPSRTISTLELPELVSPVAFYRGGGGVCLRLSEDASKMVVYDKLSARNRVTNSRVCIVDVVSKEVLKSFTWEHSGMYHELDKCMCVWGGGGGGCIIKQRLNIACRL